MTHPVPLEAYAAVLAIASTLRSHGYVAERRGQDCLVVTHSDLDTHSRPHTSSTYFSFDVYTHSTKLKCRITLWTVRQKKHVYSRTVDADRWREVFDEMRTRADVVVAAYYAEESKDEFAAAATTAVESIRKALAASGVNIGYSVYAVSVRGGTRVRVVCDHGSIVCNPENAGAVVMVLAGTRGL